MDLVKKTVIFAIMTGVLLAAYGKSTGSAASTTAEPDWPKKTIEIVVGFSAGQEPRSILFLQEALEPRIY